MTGAQGVRVDVWLMGFDGGHDEKPTEALRRVFHLDAQQALTLELTVPCVVQTDVDETAGARLVMALRRIGGRAEARPQDPATLPGYELVLPESRAPKAGSRFPPPPGVSSGGDARAAPVKVPPSSAVPNVDGSSKPRRRRAPRGTGPRERLRPEELQVAKVAAKQRATTRQDAPSANPRLDSGFDWSRLTPLLGALIIGAGSLGAGLWRGESSLLGTGADPMAIALDGLGFGALGWALLALGAVLQRRALVIYPGLLLLILGAGGAYGINTMREPKDDELAGDGVNAESLVQEPNVHFVRLGDGAEAFITELRSAGALSVQAVGIVDALGYRAVHGLHIRLPPGAAARTQVSAALQRTLAGARPATPATRDWTVRLEP